MSILATVLLLALSRAELIQRLKSPVVTQADGYVQVYANCTEDLRREYQSPIARFAADTVQALYRGLNLKPRRFEKPELIIHIGDVRTNVNDVIVKVATNAERVVTRIYLPSPGYADLKQLRQGVIAAFFRSVRHEEVEPAVGLRAFHAAIPSLRIADEREELEAFINEGRGDFERGTKLLRKIIEPGKASRRDVLTFAARLFLYPAYYDQPLLGKFSQLSFTDAMVLGRDDATLRLCALHKADEIMVFGGGRSPELQSAAQFYFIFLKAFASGQCQPDKLAALLEVAKVALDKAWEEACKYEGKAST